MLDFSKENVVNTIDQLASVSQISREKALKHAAQLSGLNLNTLRNRYYSMTDAPPASVTRKEACLKIIKEVDDLYAQGVTKTKAIAQVATKSNLTFNQVWNRYYSRFRFGSKHSQKVNGETSGKPEATTVAAKAKINWSSPTDLTKHAAEVGKNYAKVLVLKYKLEEPLAIAIAAHALQLPVEAILQ